MSKSSTPSGPLLNRRDVLRVSAAAAIGAAVGVPSQALGSTGTEGRRGNVTCSTPDSAVAKTQYGKVRGYLDDGVLTFKGIPYGQNTGGENRWLPAKPPVPWKDEYRASKFTDVYPALIYGANCPQFLHDWTALQQSFIQDWTDGYQSEDMLKVNIWTPALTGSRAVMVYLHGGGYSFGSAYELSAQDGAQLARHHDVVSVTVNHRLNILGFFDASEIGGSAYEDSANVGMTDLVACLKWVHENIANFGGDPDRVMIYGQSGGGSKVTTLMGMPAAAGLYHRASAQSGGGGNIPTKEQQTEVARQMMKDLGLAPNDIASLQKMDWHALWRAGNEAVGKVNPHGRGMFGPFGGGKPRAGWQPCVDGKNITMRSFHDVAPEISKHVPMMMGSVSQEGNEMLSNPTETEWHTSLAKLYGEQKATAVISTLKSEHPDLHLQTLSFMCPGHFGLNTLFMRNNVVKMAELKHGQNAAPAYAYYFSWQTPILDSLPGAWHTSELQFCFDNTLRCKQGTGNTPEAQVLARKMTNAWTNFAKTGNPSQPGLAWEPTNPETNKTMEWNNHSRMVNDPDGKARKIVAS